MTAAEWFRENTEIVLPKCALSNSRAALKQEFRITIVEEDETLRLIGSPAVIIEVRDWLSSRGISLQ
ncbi:VNG_1110C family protein [Haladaptatus halobius]|uniref:VNG_1110C family protein n=1 Tax=Haladaptatus halobius TaxID=2884875 RepID=UPI001D0AC254|nr:hypothetical protein [Haladaptatus halobius]